MLRTLVALVLVGSPIAATAQPPRIGQPAPEFSLTTLDGKRLSLSDLHGHPVIVNFWASWCPPCRVEMPEIIATYRSKHDAGLEVLAVNATDQDRSKKAVRRFIGEFGFPFPVVLDERGKTFQRYGLRGLPSTVFVDSAGIVREFYYGPMTSEMLTKAVATILPDR